MSSPPPQYEYFSNHPFQIVQVKPLQGSYPAQGYYLPTGNYPQQNARQQQYHQPSSAQDRGAIQQEKPADPALVTANQTPVVRAEPDEQPLSFTCAIILSCVALWCCGFLVGVAAYFLAVNGQNRSEKGDKAEAKKFLYASYAVSILGIVIGVGAIITVIVLQVVYIGVLNIKI